MIDAASAEFERVVRQLPPDSWDRPTPSDVSVRELVNHVVVGNRLTALLLTGVDRGELFIDHTAKPGRTMEAV